MNFNYSIAVLKKAAFVDELNNTLKISRGTTDNDIVIKYLEKRIAEINESEKKMNTIK
jgi:hypothetical protein